MKAKLLVYLPNLSPAPGLEQLLAAHSADAVFDLATGRESDFEFLVATRAEPVAVRVDAFTDVVLRALHRFRSRVGLLVCDVRQAHQLGAEAFLALGVPYAFEVFSPLDVLQAHAFRPEFVIARGHEGAGAVSPHASFVLHQYLARKSYLPYFIKGGVDVASAGALLRTGAAGVAVDCALWMFEELAYDRAAELGKIGETDTMILDDGTGRQFRFFAKPSSLEARYLRDIAYAEPQHFARRLKMLSKELLIVGLDAYWARRNVERYGSLGAWLSEFSAACRGRGSYRNHFGEGEGVARSTGCRWPVFQGPMARISESPSFVAAVAEAGALPFVGLSRLDGAATRRVLEAVRARGVRYGVGLVGLDVDPQIVDEQLEVLADLRPPFAVVAAPKAELLTRLADLGVAAYAHAPTTGSFKTFHDLGYRRFILEGSESGGHVGVLSSLVLWQNILNEVRELPTQDVELVFAGGVVSPTGVAFLNALVDSYGLSEQARVGVQMGTAYLATPEIVSTGAMSRNYQRLVVDETETVVTGETLNIRVRQVRTEGAKKILERERELVRQGLPLKQRKEIFERENIGNLSKAVYSRDGEAEGSYMAGDGICCLETLTPLPELHRSFCEGAGASPDVSATVSGAPVPDLHEPIAIVGMACLVPDAATPEAFFENLLAKRCSIRDVPASYWDPDVFWSADKNEPCRTYSKIGGFVGDVPFPCAEFKIPPRVASQMDDAQKWALMCARRALDDAGLLSRPFERERTAVIIANSMGGELNLKNIKAIDLHEFKVVAREALGVEGREVFEKLSAALDERVQPVEITGDTLPGELSNVIAGRIAQFFDLHGPNFTVDAACASGLAAVMTAVQGLHHRDFDVAVTGGVDTQMGPSSFVKFAKAETLSAEGSFPFDRRASGFVMGEGCCIFVLKRYGDALRDADRIYALIRGIGCSSDGRGKSIAAPSSEGQSLAVRRALEQAGVRAEDVSYVEAHGTGTPVGDPTELETLRRIFAGRTSADPVFVGSVKANVGHLRAGAGALGLMKVALCVNQRAVPPQAGFDRPAADLDPARDPFSVNRDLVELDRTPVLAGVNSFGFGGTNFHVILQDPPLNRRELHVRYPQPRFARSAASARPLRRAFLFPGQSAQYVNMLVELRGNPTFESFLARADKVYRANHGEVLTDFIYPSPGVVAEQAHLEHRELLLQNTIVAQPAILAVSAALLELLRERGVDADLCFGHSLGEYTALYAAGVMEFEDVVDAVTIRGKYMTALAGDDLGTMAFVAADRPTVEKVLAEVEGYVVCANVNSPTQTIISGRTRAVEAAVAAFDALGLTTRRLPVSAAFHSDIVKNAAPLFRKGLSKYKLHKARLPVSSNIDARFYPLVGDETLDDEQAAEAVRDRLTQHVYSPVDFIRQVHRAYELGVREFIEVGPKNILTRLVQANLPGKPIKVLYTNHPKESTLALLDGVVRELQRGATTAPATAAVAAPAPVPVPVPVLPSSPSPVPAPLAPPSPPPPKKQEQAPAEPAPVSDAKRQEVQAAVRAVVAEVSGYPADMLAADADFESDLGIDTIKIFEVLTKLRERYPEAQGKRRNLSKLTTIVKVTDYIVGTLGTGAGTGPAGQAAQAAPAAPAGQAALESSSSPLRRQRLLPYLTLADATEPTRPFLRMGSERVLVKHPGDDAFMARVRAFLEGLGHEVDVFEPSKTTFDDAGLAGFCQRHRAPSTYLHFVRTRRWDAASDAARIDHEEVSSLFLVARAFGASLRHVLVVTDLDGAFGLWDVLNDPDGGRPAEFAWIPGALAGLAQSVAKDLETTAVQLLDFDGLTERTDLDLLLGAARFDPRHPMEGVPDRDSRVRLTLLADEGGSPSEALALGELGRVLGAAGTVVVTGGARGIASLLVERLARDCRCQVLALGRSEDPGAAFKALPGFGTRVRYEACDVASAEAVRAALATLPPGRPVDVLVHAAGVESSRSLGRKSPAEFASVWAPKVAGLRNLLLAFGATPPKLVVNFSSVAGLYGNHGQVDYAAANGFLDFVRPPEGTRVVNLAWAAWSDVGMASRGSVKELLERSGATLVRPAEGTALLLRELADGLAGRRRAHAVVAVHGSLGPAYGELPWPPVALAAAERDFTPSQDVWLRDHAIDGRCYLPAVAAVGQFIRAVEEPGDTSFVLEDLRFLAPVKLADDERVRTRVVRDGDRLTLVTQRRQGSSAARTKANFQCRFRKNVDLDEQARRDSTELSRIKGMARAEDFPTQLTLRGISRDEMYGFFFHGPSFRVIESVEQGTLLAFSCRVAEAPLALPGNGLAEPRAVPYLVEAALHTCGLHCLCTVASPNYVLPAGIDRLVIRYDRLHDVKGAMVHTAYLERGYERLEGYTLRTRRYNSVVVDGAGVPLVALYGVRMIEGQEPCVRRDRLIITGVPFELRDVPCCTVEVKDAERLAADPLAAARVFAPLELRALAELSPERRRFESMAGRMALKLLVRDHLRRHALVEVALNELLVESGGRAPRVSLTLASGAAEATVAALRLSITHSSRYASAALNAEGHGVGVDVERIRPLDAAVAKDFLAEGEDALCPSDAERMALWTLKEACVKATGEGLSREPADFTLSAFDFNGKVTLVDKASGRRFDGLSIHDGDHCLSVVRELDKKQ